MSANSIVMPNDLSDLCRVCLQLPEESQYLDLTTIYDEDDNLSYSECFTICTKIDLHAGIGVPHHLCKSCGLELQMSYDFYKKIEDSKRIIEQYQQQMHDYETSQAEDRLPKAVPQEQKLQRCQTPEEKTEEKTEEVNHEAGEASDLKLTDMVVEEEEPSSQSQDTFMETEERQEYLTNSEEEDNAVNILGKLAPSISNQTKKEEPLDECVELEDECVGLEEHLEIDDFQNFETLEEEETETLQIKSDESVIPLQLIKCKTNEIENGSQADEEEENYKISSQELEGEENHEDLTWQENVVAVANKEHLPVEAEYEEILEQDAGDDNETDYTKEKGFIIIQATTDNDEYDDDDDEEEIEIEIDDDHNLKSKTKNSMKTIVKRKRHVGSRTCDYCQKIFPNYSRMLTHRRCHELDRPKYPCEYCNRMYATRQAKEVHVQTAHQNTGYSCNICSKVFAVLKSLEIHMRYHTGDFPYQCDLCDKKFAQACHLNTHKNVKHNNVRFYCDYHMCGKFFTSSTSLRNHEYTHGIMPFECEYCQQGYPAKAKLKVHVKRKHGIDLSKEQLEKMRKFHVMRSKLNLVKVIEVEDET